MRAATDDCGIAGDPVRCASSDTARRGVRATCGAPLFWQRQGAEAIPVAPGRHIRTSDKGGYCEIADGLPRDEG